VSEGSWSNGGDPMGFLGGYSGDMAHANYVDGMFSGTAPSYSATPANYTGYQPPTATGFNYFLGNKLY